MVLLRILILSVHAPGRSFHLPVTASICFYYFVVFIPELFDLHGYIYSWAFYFSWGYCEWNCFPDFILSKSVIGVLKKLLILVSWFFFFWFMMMFIGKAKTWYKGRERYWTFNHPFHYLSVCLLFRENVLEFERGRDLRHRPQTPGVCLQNEEGKSTFGQWLPRTRQVQNLQGGLSGERSGDKPMPQFQSDGVCCRIPSCSGEVILLFQWCLQLIRPGSSTLWRPTPSSPFLI